MILVTVGMHTDGFPRLVKEMDCVAQEIDEEVVMQIGATKYEPVAARWFTFAPQQEMAALSERARLIISHAGAGSILMAMQYRKPMIVVPRLRQYGEVMDDHQLELAEALADAGVLLVARDVGDLRAQVEAAGDFVPRPPNSSTLLAALREAILPGNGMKGA